MSAPEVSLVARAAGVRTHLVTRPMLDRAAEAADVPGLVRQLRGWGADLDTAGDSPDAAAMDRAVGRTALRHLRTLERWQVRGGGAVEVVTANLERRAMRALIRGAAQGAPVPARLDGVLPTRRLPVRALEALAREATPAAVVRHLVLLHYPGALDWLPLVRQAQPDLLAIDVALLRAFAVRARAAAAGGDRVLRQYVGELIDLGNLLNALLVRPAIRPESTFVDGGRWLAREAFERATSAPSRDAAGSVLRVALAGSPLARLSFAAGAFARLDREFLREALARYRALARRDPLSSAGVIAVLLQLEAQSRDLRALTWGIVFGTPPARRREELLTP